MSFGMLLKAVTTLLLVFVIFFDISNCAAVSSNGQRVHIGNEILRQNDYGLLAGHRVAVLSNPTGVYPDTLTHIVDDMKENQNVNIVAILSPEHGFRGEKQAETGDPLVYIDKQTKLPVYSAYKLSISNMTALFEEQKITAIVVDMQDVGVRLYTFIWTMYNVLQAAAKVQLADSMNVFVCDRPNPLGGELVTGPLLDMSCCVSGYGRAPITHVHGLTIGELANYFNGNENTINNRESWQITPRLKHLNILPMSGWRRSMEWPETRLPWVVPSPNIPTFHSAIAYASTVFLEATTISEGRGTTTPFEVFGAPFVNAKQITRYLNTFIRSSEDGINCFREAFYEPTFSKYNGSVVNGVQFVQNRCDSDFSAAIHILTAFHSLSMPNSEFVWDGSWFGHPGTILIDEYAGTPDVRLMIDAGTRAEDIIARFQLDVVKFREMRRPYLIY